MEQVFLCPLCHSTFDRHRFFARVGVRYMPQNILITYYICNDCGLVFLGERQTEKEQEDYYMKGVYRELVQGTPAITPRVIEEQTQRTECLLPYIDHEPKKVLDIGASTGILLDALREKYDCEVLGVEPGEHFRINNPYGVKMYSELGMLYTPEYYNRFDMITIIHVLEHMNDPVGFLVKLHEFIAEDSALYIEVPHLCYEQCLSISHPVIFTPDTLTYTLKRAGWEVEWIERYYGFKHSRTNPPNILVKAIPGNVDEFITKPDVEAIAQEYSAGQKVVAEDFERWQKEREKK